MKALDQASDFVETNKENIVDFVKDKMFDIIAVFILVAMTALTLGVLELREITVLSIINMLLECIPFYLSSVLLAVNYYTKGTFAGKMSQAYISANNFYSELVAKLTGHHLVTLSDFCNYYNERSLKDFKTNILKKAALSYERYDEYTLDKDGKSLKPLKICSKQEIIKLYGLETWHIVQEAKHVKIKGLKVNTLLGNFNTRDSTDLGPTEQELSRVRRISYSTSYIFTVILMTIIGVKDILNWGWTGILFTIFKLIYIFCRSYTRYFDGFKDITEKVTNHMNRKCDVLKEFNYWYDINKSEELVKVEKQDA